MHPEPHCTSQVSQYPTRGIAPPSCLVSNALPPCPVQRLAYQLQDRLGLCLRRRKDMRTFCPLRGLTTLILTQLAVRDRSPHRRSECYALEVEADTPACFEIEAQHKVVDFGGVSGSCTANTEIGVDIRPRLLVLRMAQVCLGPSSAGVVPDH